MRYSLRKHQLDALSSIRAGSIVYGGVGSGKTLLMLSYYFQSVCNGTINKDGSFDNSTLEITKPLYVITTASKRDSLDWELEASRIGIYELTIDSWNNIGKYTKVENAFFIFDEHKVGGHGKWSKDFLKIAKKNEWILGTATPGDTWSDYATVFIANGFYKSYRDFNEQHVVFVPFLKYPKVHHYVNTRKLVEYSKQILVPVVYQTKAVLHYEVIPVHYDSELYEVSEKGRWDTFENKPIMNPSSLCYSSRRICNSDPSRMKKLLSIVEAHKKVIVFYNFTYEAELIKEGLGSIKYGEYNGQAHDPIPEGDEWVYIAQYGAWGEGGNCTQCNCIVFYSLPYSYRQLAQGAGRINRLNTNYTDLYYYLFSSSSPIDRGILNALRQKKNFNEKNYEASFSDKKTQKIHSV